jgi:ceramide glucosyltransferase
MIDFLFISLAIVIVLQSLAALVLTLRSVHYAHTVHTIAQHRYQPRTIVIVPCKATESTIDSLGDNIRGFCNLDYRDYELIFVTENEQDSAYRVIENAIKDNKRSAWLITAGESIDEGQKIRNLRVAVDTMNSVDRGAEVVVFADSDFCPPVEWLAELATSVDGKRVGAATGYRWFVPENRSFVSLLLSVWNSSALSVLGDHSSFAWGGSTAMMRSSFEKLGVKDRWHGALSDDFVLSKAVHESGMRIRFVPGCLVAATATSSFSEMFEFTTRQMRITRVYAPGVWKLSLVTNLLFSLTFWGGLFQLAVTLVTSHSTSLLLASLLAVIFVLGFLNGMVRSRLAAYLLTQHRSAIRRSELVFAMMTPISSLLYLANAFASLTSSRIGWAGIDYEMVSDRETRIIARPATPPVQPSADKKIEKARVSS